MSVWRRVGNLFRRERLDGEIEAELRAHIEMRTEENVAAGMTPEAARRDARVRFGNPARMREQVAGADRALWLERVWQDFRYALRQLRMNPGFAATAIVVLALGLGASVAIFAFADAALLEPLPYADPGRLMSVNESGLDSPLWPLSYLDFLDWQKRNRSFQALEIYMGAGYLLGTNTGAEPVQGERVSGGFFRALGVQPMLGRDFAPGENRPGGPNVVLLSFGTWLHRFGARSDVVGKTAVLDGRPYTIIGVLPRTFSFGPSGGAEFWTPVNRMSPHEQKREFYDFLGLGRLRDGVTAQQAQTEMTAIQQSLRREYGVTFPNIGARVVPLSEQIVGGVRPILLTLLGGAGLLLLIAVVNVAGLVLTRSESRRREIAVRGALGATPGRLSRQFAMEGLVLACAGFAGGLGVAAGLMRGLGRLVPKDMAAGLPFLESAGTNLHTVLFAASVAAMALVLIAVTPTLRLAFQEIRDGLNEAGHGASGRLWRRLGANLVTVELAVAVVLLAGAGLLGRSLYRLLHVPLGFDPRGLATLQVSAPGRSDAEKLALYRQLMQRISAVPGVESVALTSKLPVEDAGPTDRVGIVGRAERGFFNGISERHVSSDYLRTLKAHLLRGRFFTDAEDEPGAGVAVINQTMARRLFGDGDPIGQKISNEEGGQPSVWQIVGVVDDVREGAQDEAITPAEYFPIHQTRDYYFNIAARSSQDAASLLPTIVRAIRGVDPTLGVSDEATMKARIGGTEAALMREFASWLIGGFATLALVLAVVGLYGVVAYSVSRRTREIGVRMALGAGRNAVYRHVLGESMRLAIVGTGIGLVGAVAAATLMRKLLYGTQAWDAWTLAAAAVVMAAAAIAASYLPARRAAFINPVEALRAE